MSRPLLIALILIWMVGCSTSAPESPASTGYAGPALPGAASANTRAGALAYAEHYIATYNYARTSGDLNGLAPLEADECLTCQALRHRLADVFDNGGRIDGGEWTLLSPTITAADADWVIEAPLRVSPSTVYPATAGPQRLAARTTTITLRLTRITGAWKVLACDQRL